MDASTKLGTPALVGFIAGKAADQWNNKSPSAIQDAILHQLGTYFGPTKVRNEFLGFHIKNWTDEIHMGGGPCNYTPPGQMHNFYQLRQPHKNVHFAGNALFFSSLFLQKPYFFVGPSGL